MKYDFNYWNFQKCYPEGSTLTNKIIPFCTHLTILSTVMRLPFTSSHWHYLSQSVSHLLPNPTHYFQIFEKLNAVHATLLNMLLLWFPWLYTQDFSSSQHTNSLILLLISCFVPIFWLTIIKFSLSVPHTCAMHFILCQALNPHKNSKEVVAHDCSLPLLSAYVIHTVYVHIYLTQQPYSKH